MRGQEDHDLRLGATLAHAAEEGAEDGQVAEERDLRQRPRFIAADEAADDPRLAVAQADCRVGTAVLKAVRFDVLDVQWRADLCVHGRRDAPVLMDARRAAQDDAGLAVGVRRRRRAVRHRLRRHGDLAADVYKRLPARARTE